MHKYGIVAANFGGNLSREGIVVEMPVVVPTTSTISQFVRTKNCLEIIY